LDALAALASQAPGLGAAAEGFSVSTIDDENQVFLVVANAEGQHSIWPDFKPVPEGWREVGFRGLKKACLEHIAEVWTDMRPLSLQQRTSR
jgi:MbtH protein